jgi:hypothetical protein
VQIVSRLSAAQSGTLTDPAISPCTAEVSGHAIPCVFQEPIFSAVDESFLVSLGHTVVRSPKGFELVDADALLFGVHLYRPVYEMALADDLPRIFVGTGWDVWDGVVAGAAPFESMEVMERTYEKFSFPQDGTFAFSSTSLYWNMSEDKAA